MLLKMLSVAPHVGAWIEIDKSLRDGALTLVAPHVGAWIEIGVSWLLQTVTRSHPTWVRGLKSDNASGRPRIDNVAPHVGAWIEI